LLPIFKELGKRAVQFKKSDLITKNDDNGFSEFERLEGGLEETDNDTITKSRDRIGLKTPEKRSNQ